MLYNELKCYLKEKKRKWQVRKRVIGFKKKIQRLEKHKNKMRRKSSFGLPIP